jgi:hypothetical protein
MKNERLVAPFNSTVTRFKSVEPTAMNSLSRQSGTAAANALNGLASAGQQ